MMQAQLGMIPSWQHSSSPGLNIKLNDNVSFPDGWSQGTIQPVGAYYTTPRIGQPNLGRPIMMTSLKAKLQRLLSPACCEDCRCGEACPGCPSYQNARSMAGLGADSWAYEHRRALLLTGLGLFTAAALGVTAHFIK